jgi:hypothetical protein
LSLGDNSSSVDWLHKASIDPSKNSPLFLATRKFAQIMIASNSCIYSQHIPGISNKITNALSQRFDLDDATLTALINSFPLLPGANFFKNLPSPSRNKFLDDLLAAEMQRDDGVTQNTKSVECGKDGVNTLNQLGLPMVASTVQEAVGVRCLGQMWGTTPHMDTDVNHYIHYLPGSLKECEI